MFVALPYNPRSNGGRIITACVAVLRCRRSIALLAITNTFSADKQILKIIERGALVTVTASHWRRTQIANVLLCQTPLHGHRLRTCCTTPQRTKVCHIAMPEPNILACQHVGNLGCGNFLSVGGEFLVQQVVVLL